MRRAVVGAASATLALGLVTLSPARADDTAPSNSAWRGSTLVPADRPCDNDDVCGLFQVQPLGVLPRIISATFALEVVSTTNGCALPAKPPSIAPAVSPVAFSRPLTFECNGTYKVIASASANLAGGNQSLDRTFTVVTPAPNISAPSAVAGAARSVAVSWTPLANPPKDFRGYVVLRSAGNATEQVATLAPAARTWTDTNLPVAGGSFTYRVRTRRAGATPAAEVTSSGASSAAVVVPAADTGGGTDGGTGGATGGATGGGAGGTSGGTAGPGGGTGGTGGTGGPGGGTGGAIGGGGTSSLDTPSFRLPRIGTASGSFFPPLLAPPADAGFDAELPFDEREPGDAEAARPDDLASDATDTAAGRRLMISIAAGLVLAVWALHLRYLVRASRPEFREPDGDIADIVMY